MTAVAVGDEFHEQGAVAGEGEVGSVLGGSSDGEDVHGVDLDTRDDVAARVVCVFIDERSAEVPMPYLLFSHTKTQAGSTAWPCCRPRTPDPG